MAILTVGAGKAFPTLARAVAAAHSGDDIQVSAGTYTNDFPGNVTDLTIEGVGGMAKFVATQSPPNGKAQFVTGGNVTLRNIEVSGVAVGDENGAAVRYQGGNLTLDHVYFHDNQEGILAADDPNGSIALLSSEIANNGNTYLQHNVYINNVGTTRVDNSYIHDVLGGGSEFRSRGANTTITNSRIVDQGHGDNYTVDLPAGGNVTLQNNVFEKAAGATNPIMIHYAPDSIVPWHVPSSLTVTGNTFLNDAGASSYGIYNSNGPGVSNGGPTVITAQVSGNSVYGLSSARFVAGPANQSGTTYLTTEPKISATHPWDTSTTPVNPPAPQPTPNPSGPSYSLFSSSSVPSTVTVNDPSGVELGVKFTSNADGNITGIRFYKGPQNTGTHVGDLWDASGNKLGSVTFANETASGWQQADFATPIHVTSGQTYTASYHTTAGMYSEDDGYFSASRTSGPLTALSSSASGGNGVYAYGGGGFPTTPYASSNYWVDVVFHS